MCFTEHFSLDVIITSLTYHVSFAQLRHWYIDVEKHNLYHNLAKLRLVILVVLFCVQSYIYLMTNRSELLEIQKKMEKEGMGKKDIIQELEALREKHQNEVIAREHARKLSK